MWLAPALLEGAVVPGVVEPVMLPCALPTQTSLQLDTRYQSWTAAGRPVTVTVQRAVEIKQNGAGYVLESALPAVRSNLVGAAASRLEIAYKDSRPMRLHLGADGGVVGIDDQADHWAAMIARLTDPLGPGGTARATSLRASLAAIGAESQRRMLAGFWLPFARFCGRWLEDGTRQADGTLRVTRENDPAPLAGLTSTVSFIVDPQTGLAHSIDRVATPLAAPTQPQKERWTIRSDSLAP